MNNNIFSVYADRSYICDGCRKPITNEELKDAKIIHRYQHACIYHDRCLNKHYEE